MTTDDVKKASQRLYDEVVAKGMCVLCGACVGQCPYFHVNRIRGTVQQIDLCDLEEGQCYERCPRTHTDMDALYRMVFGVPYDKDKLGIGVVRDIFLARSTDPDILEKGQDGGVVSTLLLTALNEGLIDGAVETRMDEDKSPRGYLATSKKELIECAGNSYEPSASLEALNRIPEESDMKLGAVGLPCQVLAVAKMRMHPFPNRKSMDHVRLVLGLFCGWSLSPGVFHRFLQGRFDLPAVVKFDIPHHPAHSFDVYTFNGKESIDLEEIRQFINPSCQYCPDMTSQFADISVGSGRAKFPGWNTVIVRTEIGIELIEMAKRRRMVEMKPIPKESVRHLRKASLNKMKQAIASIEERSGSQDDLGYLDIDSRVLEGLHEDVDTGHKT